MIKHQKPNSKQRYLKFAPHPLPLPNGESRKDPTTGGRVRGTLFYGAGNDFKEKFLVGKLEPCCRDAFSEA